MGCRHTWPVVLVSLTLFAGCGGDSGGSTGASQTDVVFTGPSTTLPALTDPADVLAEVQAAPAITDLPSDVTPTLLDVGDDEGFKLLEERKCLPSISSKSMDVARCAFGDQTAERKVVILGDSHASMWLPALDVLAKKLHWKLYVFSKVSCGAASLPNPWLSQESRVYTECIDWHQWAHKAIRDLKPDLVLLTSLVNAARSEGGNMDPDHWRQALEKTITEIAAPDTTIAVLGDIPEMERKPPDCLAASLNKVQRCSTVADKAVRANYQTAEQQAATNTQSTYIDTIPWFCSSTCTAVIGHYIVYSDKQHATATYILHLAGALEQQISPLVKPA